jgi:hypothetical protein
VIVVLRSPKNPQKDVAIAYGDYAGKLDRTHGNRVRSEQLVLLSQHPPCPPKKLSPIPPPHLTTSSKWAEPGWHLNLEIPPKSRNSTFLPAPPSNKVFNSLHSEICTGTGHQLRSLVESFHLRSLVVDTEINNAPSSESRAGDLLSLTEEEIMNSLDVVHLIDRQNSIISKKRKKSSRKISTGSKQKSS